jgi:hypothetical protein
MRALGLATVLIGITISAAPASAARFVVEYSCRSDTTVVQLAASRDHSPARVFQTRVRNAVMAGRCKIVRYHSNRGVKTARRAAKPRSVAARKAAPAKTVTYVPTGTVRPIRVSYAPSSSYRHEASGRFPGPPLFMPVR